LEVQLGPQLIDVSSCEAFSSLCSQANLNLQDVHQDASLYTENGEVTEETRNASKDLFQFCFRAFDVLKGNKELTSLAEDCKKLDLVLPTEFVPLGEEEQLSVSDLLEKAIELFKIELEGDIKSCFTWFISKMEYEENTALGNLSSKASHLKQRSPSKVQFVKEGYKTLISKMKENLEENQIDIKLGQKITRVEWGGNSVKLFTEKEVTEPIEDKKRKSTSHCIIRGRKE